MAGKSRYELPVLLHDKVYFKNMNITAPLITIITLFLLTGFASWRAISSSSQVKGIFAPTPEQTQEEPTSTPTDTPPTAPTTESSQKTPTSTASPLSTATPVPSHTNTSTSLSAWQYPGSFTVSQTNNSLSLTSSDNPDTITDWYKSKIQLNGYSTRSFVTTKTNGQVKNVLVGAKDGHEIRIEMEKSSDSQTTTITVTQS